MRFRLLGSALVAFVLGCGAKVSPAPSTPPSEVKSPSAVDAGASPPHVSLPDKPMPPESPMPSSRVAQSARVITTPEDPSKKRVMKPFGPPLRVTLDEKGPASASRVHLEAGHCYRATATATAEISSAVLVLRDSAGAKVAESPLLRLPTDGTVCASVTDDAEFLISVGKGKGEVLVKWESD